MNATVYGIPLWLITIVVTLIAPVLIYLIMRSFREGREISFWPPRIGPRPLDKETEGKKSSSETSQLASSFFLEEFPSDFNENFEPAKEVLLMGVTLRRILKTGYGKLEEKLRKGHIIRVLLVHPEGASVEMAASRYYAEMSRDPDLKGSQIQTALQLFCSLRDVAPQRMEIRTICNPLTFGGICVNPDSASGILYLEHFPYRTVADALPKFVLRASDGQWYDFFNKEIQVLWDNGVEWECSE
ncbi:MAG: hypothetical protein GF309_13720 [Candidatus Lokiarchaeota archaeon]|nr:hypothetical protein [Candidatus Lokiarchaeota archaeon]